MQLEAGAGRVPAAMSSLSYLRTVMVSGMCFLSRPALFPPGALTLAGFGLVLCVKAFPQKPGIAQFLLPLTRVTESPGEALTRWAAGGSRLRSAIWWGSYFRMWIFLGHFFLA